MTLHEFLNVARKLNFIDRDDVPFLNDLRWGIFCHDQVGFLTRADDETAQRIWEKIR